MEKEFECRLQAALPDIPWSVKNQARTHQLNNNPPYLSSVDAMSKFPETATALGLRLDDLDNVVLSAPCGIDDALNMIIRPTPLFASSPKLMETFERRIIAKNLQAKWPKVTIDRQGYLA